MHINRIEIKHFSLLHAHTCIQVHIPWLIRKILPWARIWARIMHLHKDWNHTLHIFIIHNDYELDNNYQLLYSFQCHKSGRNGYKFTFMFIFKIKMKLNSRKNIGILSSFYIVKKSWISNCWLTSNDYLLALLSIANLLVILILIYLLIVQMSEA